MVPEADEHVWVAAGHDGLSIRNIGDYPITGNWDGNCSDTIGVFRTSDGVANWLLKNSLQGGSADVDFNFGVISDKPITGKWQ
jgi:hypothetical protein